MKQNTIIINRHEAELVLALMHRWKTELCPGSQALDDLEISLCSILHAGSKQKRRRGKREKPIFLSLRERRAHT